MKTYLNMMDRVLFHTGTKLVKEEVKSSEWVFDMALIPRLERINNNLYMGRCHAHTNTDRQTKPDLCNVTVINVVV